MSVVANGGTISAGSGQAVGHGLGRRCRFPTWPATAGLAAAELDAFAECDAGERSRAAPKHHGGSAQREAGVAQGTSGLNPVARPHRVPVARGRHHPHPGAVASGAGARYSIGQR